jgi:uncharacterized protein YukE
MPSNGVVTNFSQYSVAQLNQMLDQGDPTSCQNAAQTWDSTGQLLSEQAQNLQAQLSSLDPTWTGTAATDYQQMMTDLVAGIQKVANTAFTMRDVTYDALDALNTARAEMPAPVSVPTVSPATVTLASAPIDYSVYLSPQVAAQLEQQQADAQQAVAQQQQAEATASAAQAQAVAVMQTLAGNYMTAQAGIPPSPDGSVPAVASSTSSPSATTSGAGVSASAGLSGALLGTPSTALPTLTSSGTSATTLTSTQSSPLFGDMFTLGLAATAAVAAIGPGLLMPSALVSGGRNSNQNAQAGSGTSQLGGGAVAAGGAAAGAVGGTAGAVGGGSGGVAAAPSVDAGAGGADAVQAAANHAGTNAAGAAVSSAASGDQMPMMPMGGMGAAGMGGDSGGNRRTPPWLVEHQDVWGASFPASPGLIGEEL